MADIVPGEIPGTGQVWWFLGGDFIIFGSEGGGLPVIEITRARNIHHNGHAMKILALEHPLPGISAGELEAHLKQEALHVWRLQQEGAIREIYFRADRREAVLMLEAHDEDEARHILATLPLVRERLIAFDVIPLVPYSGFERLFGTTGVEPGSGG
jgi:muconolactone delta-isomerase